MFSSKKSRLAASAASLAILLASFVPVAQSQGLTQGLKSDQDLGAQWRVNSTAKMLSGLSPMYPGHIAFSETDAWKEHSAHMKAAWAKMNEKQVSTMTAWRDGAVSKTCPVGKTLLYP